MKKICRFAVALLWIISMIVILPSNVYGQEDGKKLYDVSHNNSVFDQNPVWVLDYFHQQANKKSSDRVQRTKLDKVESTKCDESIAVEGSFTITRTLCNIKMHIWDYLQYVMYVGLAAATILLIWNWFKLVTASDREKQIWTFKKNLIYIIIWVVLLVAFYFIVDVFVSFVNLVAE